MEEDIKTIEHIIDEYKKLDILHSAKTPCSEITALQNLIARYKEVEEDIKYISEEKWKADEAVIFLTERLENALKDRIPKSKVKEEYVSKKELKRIIDENMYLEMMQKLRRILED